MTGKSSNTGQKRKPGTFQSGDPRINRKGRPKSFDTFRALALEIADEKVKVACEKLGINSPTKESENLTVAAFILRKWAFSSEPVLQKAFAEVAFGKVPETLNLSEQLYEVLIGKRNKD